MSVCAVQMLDNNKVTADIENGSEPVLRLSLLSRLA